LSGNLVVRKLQKEERLSLIALAAKDKRNLSVTIIAQNIRKGGVVLLYNNFKYLTLG